MRHDTADQGSSPLVEDDELIRRVKSGLLQLPDGADNVLRLHVAGGVVVVADDQQARVAPAASCTSWCSARKSFRPRVSIISPCRTAAGSWGRAGAPGSGTVSAQTWQSSPLGPLLTTAPPRRTGRRRPPGRS